MIPVRYSEARGTLISEKNLKSKISCQTPFKFNFLSAKYLHVAAGQVAVCSRIFSRICCRLFEQLQLDMLPSVRACCNRRYCRLFEHVSAGDVVACSSMLQPDMLQPDMLPLVRACCSRTFPPVQACCIWTCCRLF